LSIFQNEIKPGAYRDAHAGRNLTVSSVDGNTVVFTCKSLGANLSYADLSYANMIGCNTEEANMTETNLDCIHGKGRADDWWYDEDGKVVQRMPESGTVRTITY